MGNTCACSASSASSGAGQGQGECKMNCKMSILIGVLIGVVCSFLIFAICFNVGLLALETDVFSNMFRKSPSLPSNK
ncbi:hypothetical protein BBBOND_0108830 [Babesia bigemina]|uniref:Uncharacterized protein n=1 Tax=Babesia bigemina TaxID=5866 RepID=A0A061DA11_BABBI|nr:hypothetical protein BBBOND_0108830 [Babesia bigemina]CDR94585.1 hypothetical protein BBBOND_0108830 [Babesia bigemina]|eukprot:XP_012766771.1 hypothetical protein BBBOND_0108830 [Babesia bigemina]